MKSTLALTFHKQYIRVERALSRLAFKISGNTRPTSYPYVTGDNFRALADHIHDQTSTVQPDNVKQGDIVFVCNPMLLSYLQTIHPKIKHQYILVAHNGDESMDDTIASLLDDNIYRFYAQEATSFHPKFIPIPLGLENLHVFVNGNPRVYNALRKKVEQNPPIRKNKCFYRFSIVTNPPERGAAIELFKKSPIMETVSDWLSSQMHGEKLMTYKFVASPPGHAIESSRTFEGLYVKTVPVCKDFAAMRYFKSIGLPIWIVRDWKELAKCSEEELAKKYEDFMKNAVWDGLFMDFWVNLIRKDQVFLKNQVR